MWRNCLEYIAKYVLIGFLLTPIFFTSDAHAFYEGVREMDWSGDRCVGGGWNETKKKSTSEVLDFNPFGSNQDIDWELANGVCATYIGAVGALLSASSIYAKFACKATNSIGLGKLSLEEAQDIATGLDTPFPSITTARKVINYASYCASRSTEVSSWAALNIPPNTVATAQLALATSDATRCCAANVAYAATVTSAVTALAIIYGVANGAYQQARICGSDWKTWAKVDEEGRPSAEGTKWVKGAYSGSYKKTVQDYSSSGVTPSLADQKYREYIFGGREYADKGNGACSMPNWSSETKKSVLGYDSGSTLRYYMTGSKEAPVFACYRFLLAKGKKSNEEVLAGQKAYDCCTKRSQNVVCIENAPNVVGPAHTYEYAFCPIGSRCNVSGVWFDTYISQVKSNYGCVKTYSGCPYNHPLGGGTEVADYSNTEDLASLRNYCQYMNHCQILPIKPYVSSSSLTGAFFDSSCRDMKGDSQNTYGYSSNLVPVDVRGFTAPMAQCFKETIENVFFNRAGTTVCLDSTEEPDGSGVCISGYKYRKGEDLSTYQKSLGESGDSFFVRIQKSLQDSIKMALSIAIMFFGVSILIGGNVLTKDKIIPLVVKIAFVMYFATGNEWQSWVLNGIIDSSAELSDLMFRTDSLTGSTSVSVDQEDGTTIVKYVTDASVDQSKLDGCQFPRYNYADTKEDTKYNYAAYPPGKEYLRIWDTLDCKIARALGYGIEVSVPNLVMMILGGFLTGGAGIIFVLATFAFAFFLIAIAVRALHIFILSTISIIILFYVSPIMVTTFMFSRTKGIFDKWWKNIMGFALQPMILFAYMGILLTFFDTIIMGDVSFIGDGKSVPKQVVCSGEAVNTSIYCIFNPPISGTNGAVATYDKLKMLGIGLPILTSMNQTKISSLIKASILFFIFMSFMDKITDFAKALVGGEGISSNAMGASAMMQGAHGAMEGVQKRGMGMLKKNIAPMAMKAGGAMREGAASMASRGKGADKAGSGEKESGAEVASRNASEDSASTASNSSSKDSGGAPESANSGGSDNNPSAA